MAGPEPINPGIGGPVSRQSAVGGVGDMGRITAGDNQWLKDKKINMGIWIPFTYPFNLTGHPAASIPCGWSNEGLPIGMQIIGKRLDELTVLQVSKAFEEIAPWQEKKPIFKLNMSKF